VCRLLRNRLSAKKSRERKKAFAGILEDHVLGLERSKCELEVLIGELLLENEKLRMNMDPPTTFVPSHIQASIMASLAKSEHAATQPNPNAYFPAVNFSGG